MKRKLEQMQFMGEKVIGVRIEGRGWTKLLVTPAELRDGLKKTIQLSATSNQEVPAVLTKGSYLNGLTPSLFAIATFCVSRNWPRGLTVRQGWLDAKKNSGDMVQYGIALHSTVLKKLAAAQRQRIDFAKVRSLGQRVN